MKFLLKTTVFYWMVWGIAKALTTTGSLYYPKVINTWYDFNHTILASVPYYGDTLRALMRDNIADGIMAFWEVWIVFGLLVGILGWLSKR